MKRQKEFSTNDNFKKQKIKETVLYSQENSSHKKGGTQIMIKYVIY